MQVEALDHVNIRSRDIAASAAFYAELLGLTQRKVPGGIAPDKALWLCDCQGRAIIHLFGFDCAPGPTGPIHHVALSCTGKAGMLARLQQRGLAYDLHEASATLTQIFVRDPHGVLLELNFVTDAKD
jgi:catechol 2,3-dioxygenase-like lactoylglutathione lyase family enzyme